jgi:hypothetical protein
MKPALAVLLLSALAGCTTLHPLHWDWSGVVDMNKGREYYEADRINQIELP